MKAFENLRALDLFHAWFGPFCTILLADMGAEVVKIEEVMGCRGKSP